MMKGQSLNLVLFLLIGLFSCNEESPSGTQLIIISNSGTPLNGIVSTYSYPSKKFEEEAYRFSSTSFRATISDAILSGNELYVIKRDDSPGPDKLEVVNTSNWTSSRSANIYLVPGFTRIAVLPDKAIVVGSANDGSMHLLAFNKNTLEKEDSIFLRNYVEIRKMIVHDDKIFVSYSFINGSSKVLILSGENFEQLDEINLPDICEDLLVDSDGNVLAFYNQGFLRINSTTLEFSQVSIPYGHVFPGPGGSSFGFDRKKNIIYYFSYAAQPAPALFHLAAFNLSSELPVEIPHEFIDAKSINFNNSIDMVVMGAYYSTTNQGIVKLCDDQGKIIADFLVPNTPLEILYK